VEQVVDEHQIEIERRKEIQAWCQENIGSKVSLEQAAAIGTSERHVRVVARAGSGKTATLVNRAIYLNKQLGVPFESILLLAFNKKAAEEIKERLEAQVGSGNILAMTFHALAFALARPKQRLIFDSGSGRLEGPAKVVHSVLQELLKDPDFVQSTRSVMLAHFRGETLELDESIGISDLEELKKWRDSTTFETFRGERVKSFGELMIANFLFEHGLKYEYERAVSEEEFVYRPDFTVPLEDGRLLVIEYFGMKGQARYDSDSQRKREYWNNKPNLVFLAYEPSDMSKQGKKGIYDRLKHDLSTNEIHFEPIGDVEVWIKVASRATVLFGRVLTEYVNRCRKRALDLESLDLLLDEYMTATDAERDFLRLGRVVYGHYLRYLQDHDEIDFDGFLISATDCIANGEVIFQNGRIQGSFDNISHVLIDEFQDFSTLYYSLISEVKVKFPETNIFCVGDDWQAINGFAGADLRYFREFGRIFVDGETIELTENFRSKASIVKVGNALMKGLGSPAEASTDINGKVLLCDLGRFSPLGSELRKHGKNHLVIGVLRVVRKALEEEGDILLLSRLNSMNDLSEILGPYVTQQTKDIDAFAKYIRSQVPVEQRGRINAMTAHRAKGLQSQTVIVLDAFEKTYPLIHRTWILFRCFGDTLRSLVDEERRLFYVALTRAVSEVYIFTEKGRPTEFLKDAENSQVMESLDWDQLKEITEVWIRVANIEGITQRGTFGIKSLLRENGFQWSKEDQDWCKSLPKSEVSIDSIKRSPWGQEAEYIEVSIHDEDDEVLGLYQVQSRNQWQTIAAFTRK